MQGKMRFESYSRFPMFLFKASWFRFVMFILGVLLFFSRASAQSSAPLACRDSSRACSAYLYYELPSNESIADVESLFTVGGDDIAVDSKNKGIYQEGVFIRVACSCNSSYYFANTSYNVTTGDPIPLSTILEENYQGLAWAENASVSVTSGTDVKINLLCGCLDNTRDYGYLLSYVVQNSDTLDNLVSQFMSSKSEILAINNMTDANIIFTAKVYYIPIQGVSPASHPTSAPEYSPPSENPIDTSSSGSNKMPLGMILAIVGGGLVFVLVASVAVVYVQRRAFHKRRSVGSFSKGGSSEDLESKCFLCQNVSLLLRYYLKRDIKMDKCAKRPVTLSREMMTGVLDAEKPVLFTYDEVVGATDQFKESNLLGRGAFGSVYYGILRDQEVAIKRMKATKTKEFLAEIKVLCKLHHTNLIDLIGYASTEGELFLVYEYAENRAVSNRLHDPLSKGLTPLTWNSRVQIALDTARGLEYIHEHTKTHCVHRDIKSSNILLDTYLRAKVADFGLAKLVEKTSEGETSVTRIVGTFGYLAPEYLRDGQATAKSDVYAFGVVLFELITGQEAISKSKNVMPSTPERRSLISIMLKALRDSPSPLHMSQLSEHADSNLMDMYPHDCLYKMAKLAQRCVEEDPILRPDMKYVVFMLSQILLSSIEWEATLAGNSQVFSGLVQGR